MVLIVAATLMLSTLQSAQPVVRIYDAYGVTAADLEKARATAEAILKRAGVELRLCPPSSVSARPSEATFCDATPELRDFAVRITAAGARDVDGSLGYSLVDVDQRAGSLATIFADRVHELARQAGSNMAILLGRAMAHEIGHLLLGTSTHSRVGLMRSHWLVPELRRDLQWDWFFSGRDAAEMRRRLAARSRREAPAGRQAGTGGVDNHGS
ncbi:MAG: hypothetical protein C5B57_02785 [Blastocatellia bacterium]|nr:MAG: hypothetical protein C5B57_02785 [Blastocatellia bacterium]